MTTPPTAATNATERSIDTTSPSAISRMNTIPMASAAMGAIWRSRLVKFRAVRNWSFKVPKMIRMRISPMMIGSEPSSPARMASQR